MAKKNKVAEEKAPRIKEDTMSSENHMQVFARLAHPMFNAGAMHGAPSPRPGR